MDERGKPRMNLSDLMIAGYESRGQHDKAETVRESLAKIREEKACVVERLRWLAGKLESGEFTTAETVRESLAFLAGFRAAPPDDPGDQMS